MKDQTAPHRCGVDRFRKGLEIRPRLADPVNHDDELPERPLGAIQLLDDQNITGHERGKGRPRGQNAQNRPPKSSDPQKSVHNRQPQEPSVAGLNSVHPWRHEHSLFSCPAFCPALLPLSSLKRNKGLESRGQPRKREPFRADSEDMRENGCHFSKSPSANRQSRCQRSFLEPTPLFSGAGARVWRARYSVAW